MDFNAVFKLKQAWDTFTGNHPKFPMFLNAVNQRGIPEGTIVDFKFTYPDGQVLESNLKVTAADLELLETLKDLRP